MGDLIVFPSLKNDPYRTELEHLSEWELMDTMFDFVGKYFNTNTPEEFEKGYILFDIIAKKCRTEELRLEAMSLKQKYKYCLKDLEK